MGRGTFSLSSLVGASGLSGLMGASSSSVLTL